MTKIKYFVLLLALGLLCLPEVSLAQDLHPSRRPSPIGMARAFAGDAYVKVTYGRPYMRGRDNIFGSADDSMHPNGQVWRFGANEPTEISFSAPVTIDGARLEAGTYSIYATPGTNSWKVHFNDMRGKGAGDYEMSNDLAVIEVDAESTEESVDQFTIELNEVEDGVHLVASWTDWMIAVPIKPAM